MRTEKNKRKATICRSDGMTQKVNFFLHRFAEAHSGKELIIDVMNSKASFIPLEDVEEGEIFFLNKSKVVFLELHERDVADETILARKMPVEITLTNGDVFTGGFFIEMPQERSRVSDYINFSPNFMYLCREKSDVILNKEFMFSVKEKELTPNVA